MSPDRIQGRRAHGEAIHLQRAAAAARRAGVSFTRPPLPEYVSPEQRLDWDRFMLPALKKLHPDTVAVVGENLETVKDLYDTRMRIFHGANLKTEIAKFEKRHPVAEQQEGVDRALKPAYELIIGRFAQAGSAQRWIDFRRSMPRR